jgi:hypothetical protein
MLSRSIILLQLDQVAAAVADAAGPFVCCCFFRGYSYFLAGTSTKEQKNNCGCSNGNSKESPEAGKS